MAELVRALATLSAAALAVSIGANNSAAEMGPAYGAGILSRRQALGLIALFAFAGAASMGQRVVHTMGRGLTRDDILADNLGAVLLVSAATLGLVTLANALRTPLATSQVAVGAVVGVGLFHRAADLRLAAVIFLWWLFTPLLSLGTCWLLGRYCYPRLRDWIGSLPTERLARGVLGGAVILSSCWMAFSAGTNNVANAVGPAVGAGLLSPGGGVLLGGVGMALGALLLGGRLIATVGRDITSICPVCAVLVQLVAGSLIFAASRFGIPVSLAEIVTCAVIGFSLAANGLSRTAGNRQVRRFLALMPTAPVLAAGVTLALLLATSIPPR